MERSGEIVFVKTPRVILRDITTNEKFTLEYQMKRFPAEFARLAGHTHAIVRGGNVVFIEENGVVKDIYFSDIPDADLDQTEESIIVSVLNDGAAAFAKRDCSCTIHLSRHAAKSGHFQRFGSFETGQRVLHSSTVRNGLLTARNVELRDAQ